MEDNKWKKVKKLKLNKNLEEMINNLIILVEEERKSTLNKIKEFKEKVRDIKKI